MTSHAALVARGWGKCCIVGCGDIEIHHDTKTFHAKGDRQRGRLDKFERNKGLVYEGSLPLTDIDLRKNKSYQELMKLVDKTKNWVFVQMPIRRRCATGTFFGAEGIGFFRTEHMFYGEGSERPLFLLRKMISEQNGTRKEGALNELFRFVKKDFKDTLTIMHGHAVTFRLLDPPLHEFVPHDSEKLQQLSKELGISMSLLKRRVLALHENNRCWDTVVCVWASAIRRSRRCR